MRHSLFPYVLLVVCTAFASQHGTTQFFHRSKTMDEDKEFDWSVEENLDAKLYPRSFVDSLKKAHGVDYTRPLRRVRHCRFLNSEERLVFDVRWGFINAGYGIFELGPGPEENTFAISAKAISHRLVGALFKVRDLSRSIVDARGFYPLFFEEHIREGRYRTQRWELYDHTSGSVYARDKNHASDSMPQFAQNYISAFFYFRTLSWQPGDTVYMNSHVQGKKYNLYFICHDRDTVTVYGKEFACLRVEPRLQGKAMVFGRGDKIEIWMTDDEYRIPVFVKAKIMFGSIKCRLVYANRLKSISHDEETGN